LIAKVAAIPGVTGVGLVSHLPFGGAKSGSNVVIEGAPPPKPGEPIIAFHRTMDAGYFPALQVKLARGRFFNEHDPAGSPVAIINESLARKGWPNQDPVGKRFGDGNPAHWMTVVGVIKDLRQSSLAEEADLEAYMPYPQTPGPTMALVVRSGGNPERLAPAIRIAVRELDKDLPLAEVGLLADSVSQSTRSRRFSTWVLSGFAVLALLLAAVGIYGVISYSVSRRTHEIGVRMALGAERGRIAAMVAGRALLLAGIGVVAGVCGALALTRLLRSMLFGVSTTDPAAFAGASLFLLAVAATAGYVPARRAARIDPGVALREE
jgi:putative ABC transport system permease protein